MEDFVEIGFIINTHGVKGTVKVNPCTDYPERFKKMKSVLIRSPKGNVNEIEIEDVKYFKQFVIIKFKGVEDMEGAEKLKGSTLTVRRADAVKLPEDTYYIFDLIGCDVFEGRELLGKVKEVIETGSNDVYVVENSGKELLIPALGWVVLSVDITAKRIEVKLPEGLRDI